MVLFILDTFVNLLLKVLFRFLRCKLSETLRDTLPIPCKNALNGCEVALFKEDLNGHEELCIFRNIICANLKCNEKPVFKDYIDHFNANHVIDGDDLNGQEDCKVFKADFTMKEAEVGHARRFAKFGRNFFDFGFLYAKEPCHERILRRWLLFQGSPSEAKNFVYESSLSSPDGCKIITVGQVVSLDEQHFKKTKFKIFADIAESFAQENGFLNFTMKIRNLKEEAKDDDDESGVSDVECSD